MIGNVELNRIFKELKKNRVKEFVPCDFLIN